MMVPPLPELQAIYFLFLLLPIQVFCNDVSDINMRELEDLLKRMFAYDFNVQLEIDDVLIWKVTENHKPFTRLQYNGNDVQFGPDETYLVVTQKYKGGVIVYYRFGIGSTLVVRQMLARYAVLITEFLKTVPFYNSDSIYIAREVEGVESDSFQHTIQRFNKQDDARKEDDVFANYQDTIFPSPPPNLYVIRGINYQIKKIPLSLGPQWLKKNDTCLILEVGYKFKDMRPINYFCGEKTNDKHVTTTKDFIDQFSGYFENGSEKAIRAIENNNSDDFKKFGDIIGDSKFYKPYEVDNSGDHLKSAEEFGISREQEISILMVSGDGSKLEKGDINSPSGSGYNNVGLLIDFRSISGTYLSFDDPVNINVRVKAVQTAEKYMDETYPLSPEQIVK